MSSDKKLVDKIEEKIKSGQVKMRAKSYFIVKTILNILAGVLIGLAAIFLISFILFTLRINGIWLMPGLGFRGLMTFFISLPWILILVGLLFLLALEFFVKKYTFAYRKPVVYSVLALLLFVGLAGILVDKTPLHNQWLQKADNHNLPFAGKFYRGYKQMPVENTYVGKIQNLGGQSFELVDKENQIFFIEVTDQTRIFRHQTLKAGDLVMVMGQLNDEQQIMALGIRKIEQDFRINYRPQFRHF
jgi:hypothetical protein